VAVMATVSFFGLENTKNAKIETVITEAVISQIFLFMVFLNWLIRRTLLFNKNYAFIFKRKVPKNI
jgi:hypothetical protein